MEDSKSMAKKSDPERQAYPRSTFRSGDVVQRLKGECARVGSQRAWAKQAGVSEAYISDVLAGRREPGEAILTVLGLTRQVVYVETEVRT